MAQGTMVTARSGAVDRRGSLMSVGGRSGRVREAAAVRMAAARTVAVIAMLVASCLLGFAVRGAVTAWSGPETTVTYTVQPGDTLWSFAVRATPAGGDVNDSLDALMRINHLDSSTLEVGQRIEVPVDER